MVQRRRIGIQGIPEEHAVRRSGNRGRRGAEGHGAWAAAGRGLCPRTGFGTGDGYSLAPGSGAAGTLDYRCDPDSAQRLPASEAPAGLTDLRRDALKLTRNAQPDGWGG